MIVKENIFTKKSEDEIDEIFYKKYYGKFFIKPGIKPGALRRKIYFVNDISRKNDYNQYVIKLKVLATTGIWINSKDEEMITFPNDYTEIINLDNFLDELEKDKKLINIKIEALKKQRYESKTSN